jgi:hypothetical protein
MRWLATQLGLKMLSFVCPFCSVRNIDEDAVHRRAKYIDAVRCSAGANGLASGFRDCQRAPSLIADEGIVCREGGCHPAGAITRAFSVSAKCRAPIIGLHAWFIIIEPRTRWLPSWKKGPRSLRAPSVTSLGSRAFLAWMAIILAITGGIGANETGAARSVPTLGVCTIARHLLASR